MQSAKLPLTFPRRLQDNPSYLNFGSEAGRVLYGEDIYVGYRYYEKTAIEPLFPFGHGLSYTTFALSDLAIATTNGQSSSDASSDEAVISLSVAVTNTGPRDGAEVVQVYVSPVAPSIGRPVKELKGFKKVSVAKGRTEEVEVRLEERYATSFWDEERGAWKAEKGRYRVLVGTSSRGEMLEKEYEVAETRWWTGL